MMILMIRTVIGLLYMISGASCEDVPEISLNHQRLTQKAGKPAYFVCSFERGRLPVTFEWLKDDQLLKSSPKIIIGTSERASSLMIGSVLGSDAGNYTCRATNNFGSRISTATLFVEGPPQWISKPSDMRVSPISQLNIKCIGTGHPKPVTTWKKLIDSEWRDLFGSTTNFIRISSTEISSSQLVKEQDEGKYGCEISNGINPNSWTEFLIQISVCSVESRDLPKISLDPHRLTQKVDEMASFSCILTKESSSVKFEWFKNGQILHPTTKIAIGSTEWASTLYLKSISVMDAGNYTCQASNSLGSARSSSILIVEGPPQWQSKPNDIRVGPRERFNVKCIGIGHPLPVTTWKKFINSRWENLLESTSTFTKILPTEISGSQLLKERDEGKYGCEISNGINPNLWTEFQIQVSGKSIALSS